MKNKQIYAALDIGSYDIKLVVGEIHNNHRVNIIRVERVACTGIKDYHIVDKRAVSLAIMQALKNINELLQVKVERVLLSIPSVNMEHKSQRVTIKINHQDSKITLNDLQEAIQSIYKLGVPSEKILVNVVPVKFFVDGIASRALPLGETCEKLEVVCDAYCVDKKVAIEYCSVVEQSGLEILDIYVQPYAEAKESNILNNSIENDYIYINLGHSLTSLSYFTKGRLADSIHLKFGMREMDERVSEEFNISLESSSRLKKYSAHLFEDRCHDTPIFIWTEQDEKHSITETNLNKVLVSCVDGLIQKVHSLIKDMPSCDKIKIVLGGGGAEMFELAEYMSDKLGVHVDTYIPETMGARSSDLITCLGLFYAFSDACEYTLNDASSIDTIAFEQVIAPSTTKEHEEGFTSKLKGLLFSENREK